MSIRNIFIRISNYRREHGALHAVRHALKIAKRDLLNFDYLVYTVDLKSLENPINSGSNIKLYRCQEKEELTEEDFKQLCRFRDARIIAEEVRERFRKKAELWNAKQGENIIAFIWLMYGNTPKPYFFQLSNDDVYLFDNEVLKEQRGQGINALFLDKVLYALKGQKYGRAIIDTETWNDAQIKSLRKTKFTKYAHGRRIMLLSMRRTSLKIFDKIDNIEEYQ